MESEKNWNRMFNHELRKTQNVRIFASRKTQTVQKVSKKWPQTIIVILVFDNKKLIRVQRRIVKL